MSRFRVSPEANRDLRSIWDFSLGRMPEQGYRRADLTTRPVRLFPLYSYLIVYQPAANPVRIMAVLHGNRNLRRLLKARSL